jgi:hypothetical protein
MSAKEKDNNNERTNKTISKQETCVIQTPLQKQIQERNHDGGIERL